MRSFLLPALLVTAGDAKPYGKALTLQEVTPVSAILEDPDPFVGKTVRVKGVVADVCESRGCWIQIGGEKKGQVIVFKVDDGVTTFPMSAKGGQVVAEGVVSKRVVSEAQQKEMCEKEAKAHGKPVDHSSVKGPKTIIRLEGLGAVIQ